MNCDGEYDPVSVERDHETEIAVTSFVNGINGTDPDSPVARSVVEEIAGVADEVSAFVSAIETRASLPVCNSYARAVMQVLLAVEESSRTGSEIRLR